jgi:hypothetical protein
MTVAEFLLLHTSGPLNFSNWINVLYNSVGINPDTGLEEGRIDAITVTANALSFNGVTTQPDIDLLTILQQVETVNLIFDNVNYTFTITAVDFIDGQNAFFFFQVTSDTLVPNVNDASLTNAQYNTVVNLNPILSSATFLNSDYNITINNGTVLREHPNKLIADREAGFTNPSNFSAILSTSASKANLQESFYTSTGLTNARYEGTTTDAEDFAGVLPSFSAREFTGEIHPPNANRDYACGIGLNTNRVLVPMLHTGKATNPLFSSSSTNIETSDLINSTQTTIEYNLINNLTATNASLVEVGDLLKTSDSNEILKVVQNNLDTKILQVNRGHLQTTAAPIQATRTIEKIDRTDLFRFDQFGTNLSTVGEAIVYVQENNSLLNTDEFGTVFSSSICPDPLLLGIDNPNSN